MKSRIFSVIAALFLPMMANADGTIAETLSNPVRVAD